MGIQIPKPNNVPASGSGYLPSGKREDITTPWRTLAMMLVVFGLTVVLWVGMAFGYIPYLKSQIKGVDSNLTALSSKISKKQRIEFSDVYSQLYNIKKLASMHTDMSKFFAFLEASTYPSTIMKNVEIHSNKNFVQMSFVVPSFSTLTEQIKSYSAYPGVIGVSLVSSASVSVDGDTKGGGINASIKVLFSKGFFISSSDISK